MIKSFSIQPRGIYESRPYSKFTNQPSNNCSRSKSKHKKLQIQIKHKNQNIKNPQTYLTPTYLTPSKKKQNLSISINKNLTCKKNISSPKLVLHNKKYNSNFSQQIKSQIHTIHLQNESQILPKQTQNFESKIQLQSFIQQQNLCCEITNVKTKTPIKKFLNLIRQSKKDVYLINKLQSHSQKLDILLEQRKKEERKNTKYLEIQDIILQR